MQAAECDRGPESSGPASVSKQSADSKSPAVQQCSSAASAGVTAWGVCSCAAAAFRPAGGDRFVAFGVPMRDDYLFDWFRGPDWFVCWETVQCFALCRRRVETMLLASMMMTCQLAGLQSSRGGNNR